MLFRILMITSTDRGYANWHSIWTHVYTDFLTARVISSIICIVS